MILRVFRQQIFFALLVSSFFIFLLTGPESAVAQLLAQVVQPSQITASEVSAVPQGPEEAPDTTVFDLFLSDISIGAVLVSFTDQWCLIDNPSEIVEQLGTRISGAQEEIRGLAAGKLSFKRESTGVGSILCDLNTFRVILTIDPRNLKESVSSKAQLLPDPESAFAVQHSMQIASSGEASSPFETSAFTHRTSVGLGKYSGRVEGTLYANSGEPVESDFQLNSNSGYRLTELSGTAFWGSFRNDVGLLRSYGSNLVAMTDFAGTRLENTEQLFMDQDAVRGSSLRIFVPSHARVEFYLGPRLLASQILNAGVQEVNTSSFPQGSYDVDVMIREDNGNVSRERHFFAKSGLLVSGAHPVLTLEGGYIRDNLDITDTPVYHAGLRYRALSFLEVDPSVYGDNEGVIGGVGATAIYADQQIIAQYARGKGQHGYSVSIAGQLPFEIGWGGSQVRTFGGETDPLDLNQLKADRLQIAPGIYSWSAYIDRSFGPVRLSYAGTRSNQTVRQRNIFDQPTDVLEPNFSKSRYAYGPSIDWAILSSGRNRLTTRFSYLNTDEGKGFQTWVNYTRPLSDEWNLQSRVERNTTRGNDSTQASVDAQYNKVTQAGRGLRGEVRGNYNRQGSGDQAVDTGQGSVLADYGHDYFRTWGYFSDTYGNQDNSTNVSLAADTALFYADGKLTVSYGRTVDAGLVVDLKTSTRAEGDLEVLVNGNVFDTVPIGRSVMIPLSAFQTYRVAIRQAETAKSLVTYEASEYAFSLFPGNFLKRSWVVDRVFILIGRLVDENGEPVRYQRIRGPKDYTITEEDGTFQAEIVGTEDLRVETDKYQCVIELPKLSPTDYIADAGELTCPSHQQSKGPDTKIS